MHPNHPSKRRRRDVQLAPEGLETRELLTGGAGNTFAIIPGEITKANGTAVVKFTIDPAHFTIPKGRLALGLDVVAQPGSTVKPVITSIVAPNGRPTGPLVHSVYARTQSQMRVTPGTVTSALIAPIRISPQSAKGPVTYSVKVSAQGGTSGQFLLGFYLPGDGQGTGVVDRNDVKLVAGALGSKAGSSKYNFDADVNRDGRISAADLNYSMQNLGVKVTISPVVSANLDPSAKTGLQDRVTTNSAVKFTGVASPGATVKYEEVSKKTPAVTATADALGNYSLNTPLASGSNTFRVTTLDAFGQSITGTIDPVVYNTVPPVTKATLDAIQTQPGITVKKA